MYGKVDLKSGIWINRPAECSAETEKIRIKTSPETDLWQKTYYGFKRDTAHMFVFESYEKYFSFSVKTRFNYKKLFDQCGVVVYQNGNNWFKASSEYEDAGKQKLGSVVTNNGFSDWASQDIGSEIQEIYYRISRRYNDFLIEWSKDGKEFAQMRILHLFQGCKKVSFGIYAASPGNSSFEAEFSEMEMTECVWKEYQFQATAGNESK